MTTKVYKHPLTVRSESDGLNYSEYDKHDRCVYYIDSKGYFAFKFYHDEGHLLTPYFVLHKYHRLYNPDPHFV